MLRPISRSNGDAILKLPTSAKMSPANGKASIAKKMSQRSAFDPIRMIWLLLAFGAGMMVQNMMHGVADTSADVHDVNGLALAASKQPKQSNSSPLPYAFQQILDRAHLHAKHCHALDSTMGNVDELRPYNERKVRISNHTAHLPPFGIIRAMEIYLKDPLPFDDYPYQCQSPPENECQEAQFTVIFMAYNPDRLDKLYNQVLKFVTDSQFSPLIHEVLIVWNGPRDVDETKMGKTLVDLQQQYPVRISYPLKAGFPNDLMNRYHPRLEIKTKAIMYYDDDGPFYSYSATLGGFELWKRNSNAQIGAMARKFDYSPRQREERQSILNGQGDRFFVSQCNHYKTGIDDNNAERTEMSDVFIGDEVRYNYNEFANFGANMVLPSGSFLHSNYLCFLWHPIFAEIRQYVKDHPVNPDDGTVSSLVAQLSGRAPKVYPRRVTVAKQRRLLLSENDSSENKYTTSMTNHSLALARNPPEQEQQRRRLMDGIDWDNAHPHQAEQKNTWGRLRSDAANSLTRYFGSLNSGSIGWCYGTTYIDASGGYCKPEMAKVGMLPWMNADHSPKAMCP